MELKKLNKVLVLFLFGFFFLFNISWFLKIQILNFIDLFKGTFFENLNVLLSIGSLVIGKLIFTISLLFFVGILILLFLVFVIDVMNSKKFIKRNT